MRTSESSSGRTSLKASLWIAQLLLAALFAYAGFAKLTTPLPQLAQMLPYADDLPGWLIRFIGLAECAGALGVILPALVRIMPALTPVAALGLLTVMALATVFHIWRGEFSAIGITIAIGAVAAFVAWGRFTRVPITARTP